MLDKNRERKRFPVVSWAFPFRVISVQGEHIKCNVWIDREVMMKSGENLSEFLKEE